MSISAVGVQLQYKKIVTVVWGSVPGEYGDDELDELVDDYDPELDLLDDLYASGDA